MKIKFLSCSSKEIDMVRKARETPIHLELLDTGERFDNYEDLVEFIIKKDANRRVH